MAIADFAAIAIQNARDFQRVQELTLVDEHTGLGNVRSLRKQLDAEVTRARSLGHPLSLLFLDLDHFKTVNDTHGHLVGSALLREVGGLLREELRPVDAAFRYGGDEFAVMLVELDSRGAVQTAERLLERFRAHRFGRGAGLDLRVTASVGVAACPEHAAARHRAHRGGGPGDVPGEGARPGRAGGRPAGLDQPSAGAGASSSSFFTMVAVFFSAAT